MMNPTVEERGAESGAGAPYGLMLLLAALPIFGFQFGIGNQVEQFSLIRRFADPTFLQRDFYIESAAQFGPRYYYCALLAAITKVAPLPQVIFVLSYITNLALALATYDAARRLLRADRLGGAIAALLAVTNSGIALGLAGYLRFESYQPASLAIPLALFGFTQLVTSRRLLAAACFSAAAIAHPLVGVEIAAIAYLACAAAELVRERDLSRLLRAWAGYIPSGVLFAAVIFVAWVLPSRANPSIPDAEFFAILPAFRAPHHYLALTFPREHYAMAALFVAATGYFLAGAARAQGLRFELAALAVAVVTVVTACLANVALVDVLQNRMYATAQVFRMVLVVKWIGFLLFGYGASRWIAQGGAFPWIAAAVPVLVTGNAQPLALAGAIAVMEAARRLRPRKAALAGLAALLALFAAAVALRASPPNELVRAAVGGACLLLWRAGATRPVAARAAAAALVAGLLAASFTLRGATGGETAFRSTFDWGDLHGPNVDIARWARRHSPSDSVWLTPPDFENFRLLAERAVVADFTSVPLQDLAMREWRARLRMVYGDVAGGGFVAQEGMDAVYRLSTPERLREVGRRYGAGYAVLYAETPWPTAPLYRNTSFKAVSLAGP